MVRFKINQQNHLEWIVPAKKKNGFTYRLMWPVSPNVLLSQASDAIHVEK
jgi:hypothetical protein